MKFKKERRGRKDGLAESVIQELDALDENGLRKTIADAEQAIVTATGERNENDNYKRAKSVLKDLNGALKDTRKYQGAKISYALKRLRVLAGDLEANALDD